MLDFENFAAETEVKVDQLQFGAGDKLLTGHLYRPKGIPSAAVVLNGATGVPQSFGGRTRYGLSDL